MNKIRKGDEVVVTTGKDKTRRGTVNEVLANGRVVVSGINVVKKHQKPNPGLGRSGGIIEKEMPIDASNVALWDPSAKKAARIGFKFVGEGAARKKVRFFKGSGEVVDR
ncbi:MAG TPA: 50S ribosomal protein L24 [Candidatus Binatia bacterium]|nr:50S ribosomal protein L24 [Candidatus Binatia bacterium]